MDIMIPRAGDKYRHFRGNVYQIVTMAKDSETGEAMVVYQALYGDFDTYVRPLSMFVEELDTGKYPEATQVHRFEPLAGMAQQVMPVPPAPQVDTWGVQTVAPAQPQTAAPVQSQPQAPVQETIVDWMMKFFDTDDFDQKYSILKAMRNMEGLTDNIIDNMAATLDFVIDDGDVDDRFGQLMKCVDTRRRFETSRLR